MITVVSSHVLYLGNKTDSQQAIPHDSCAGVALMEPIGYGKRHFGWDILVIALTEETERQVGGHVILACNDKFPFHGLASPRHPIADVLKHRIPAGKIKKEQ